MKNSIWVGKNAGNDYTFSAKSKMIKNGDGFVVPLIAAEELYTSEYLADFFGLNLKNGEIAELIYDTETRKVEVKRQREIGWYLVECVKYDDDGLVFAAHWDGKNWNPVRNKNKWRTGTTWKGLAENEVTVISEKLPDNEYLRGLE